LQQSKKIEFAPVNCPECDRPNNPSVSLCLWCGGFLNSKNALNAFPTTIAELDYLSGIDRLDNPMPVRLTINADGIEVKEIMPGSRIYQIAGAAIIEARVIDKIEKVKIEKRVSLLQKFLLASAATQSQQFVERISHDYILTISYRTDDKTCTAAFHREDANGKSMVTNVAKTVNSLVKFQAAQMK
jgi:hypothetical protein